MQTEPQIEREPDLESAEETGDRPTAGDILMKERLRLGLNEKEVADQLHITMHYVRALESNSYEKLPGTVFAKGYLKSYALLLGLDVEDLLARFDEINDRQEADIREASRLVQARKMKDRNKPLVIISLAVFVAGFLGLWLVNSFLGEDAVSTTPAIVENGDAAEASRSALAISQAESSQSIPGQASDQTTPQEPVVSSLNSTTALASETSSTLVQTEPAANLDADVAVQESAASSIEPALDLQDIAAALQPATASNTAANEDPARPRVITVQGSGNDVLRISFSGESWVEVNDSESQQVYRDIREAGDVLEITGSAPFNILLGDAPFTSMSLNGNEIDLSTDIRIDNSARLTVGL